MSSSLVGEANSAVERGPSVVLTPHLNGVEPECEAALQKLERSGVRVVRRGGCSAIDVARNEMLSDALHDGAESILFIDSDIGFEPQDALRLLARPEPVVSGVYAKKSRREMASIFADGTKEVLFGPKRRGRTRLNMRRRASCGCGRTCCGA
jgi:glycosyltransferase involved in cell wall biosynthesis